MKYLVIARTRESFELLDEQKRMRLEMNAIAYLEKYRKEGKLRDVFYTPDLRGGVSIWDLQSDAEAAVIELEDPMYSHQDISWEPLLDFDAVNKAITERMGELART